MSNINSGVNHDKSLYTSLTIGPSASGNLLYSYWPEITPGYFTAGTTIHNNSDYLFAKENREITTSANGLFVLSNEIVKYQGPILASWCPDSVSGSVYSTSVATTGWVSRDTNFKELVYSTCRYRLCKSIPAWTLISSGEYNLYKYDLPYEVNGFGPTGNFLAYKLQDKSEEWQNFKIYSDFIDGSIPGLKQWASSGSSVYIKTPLSAAAPSNLSVSYISNQATLDVEELGVVSSQGIQLSVGSRENITGLEIQFPYGGSLPTGSTISIGNTFPRYVNTFDIPEGTPLIVRYKPTGVYGTTLGSTGIVVAVNLPEAGVCVFRYDAGIKGEKHSPASYVKDLTPISPVNTYPGFYLAVTKDHFLHSTTRATILSNGSAPVFSKVFAWTSHNELSNLNAPITVRTLVIGQDDIPVPNVDVHISYPIHVTGPSKVNTGLNGEAVFKVYKTTSFIGSVPISLTIQSSGVVIDMYTLNIDIKGTVSDWRANHVVGKVHIAETNDLPRSAVSSRKQLMVYRTMADGIPSPFNMESLTVSCLKGRLYCPISSDLIIMSNNSGTTLSVKKSPTDYTSFEKPIYIEYESPEFGETDTITAVWQSPSGYSPAYGVYTV